MKIFFQRARKCSIVQEEDDEEDLSSCSGREELAPPHCSLNRRGSRSEGKLNVTVQERLAESERRREPKPPSPAFKHVMKNPKVLNKTPQVASSKQTLMERIAQKRLENNKIGITNTAKSPIRKPDNTINTTNILEIENKNSDDRSKSPIMFDNKLTNSLKSPVRRPELINNTSRSIFEMDNNGKSLIKKSNDSEKSPSIFDVDNKMPNSLSLNAVQSLNSGTKSPVTAPRSPIYERSANKRPASAIEPQTSVVTTIITEASTITIPIHTTTKLTAQILPKYKTMPSPTRNTPTITLCPPQLTLNEIFEEGDTLQQQTPRQFVSRSQTRSNYEQRKSKFKNRTASCSSSDASDDDSESRKKRAHKLNNNGKPIPRRDSHDDSSDSQDPGGGTGGGASQGHVSEGGVSQNQISSTGQYTQNKSDSQNGNNTGGRKNCDGGKENSMSFGRRHRAGRRRTGETRLRESQSLNRISEVQEEVHQNNSNLVITLTAQSVAPKQNKSISSKLLNWNKKSPVEEIKSPVLEDKETKIEKDKALTEKTGRKMRLLSKYFHVHKKICIPIPGLFSRNRLHKTQSCSSLVQNGINIDSALFTNEIVKGEIKRSDINQNLGAKSAGSIRNGAIVQLNTMCSGIGVCTLHLGDASKCCSLC